MIAQEHELEDWQEDLLAEVFLAVEERRSEVEEGIDPLTEDPEEVERRFVEFDEWAETYSREHLGEELWRLLEGEEDDEEE